MYCFHTLENNEFYRDFFRNFSRHFYLALQGSFKIIRTFCISCAISHGLRISSAEIPIFICLSVKREKKSFRTTLKPGPGCWGAPELVRTGALRSDAAAAGAAPNHLERSYTTGLVHGIILRNILRIQFIRLEYTSVGGPAERRGTGGGATLVGVETSRANWFSPGDPSKSRKTDLSRERS